MTASWRPMNTHNIQFGAEISNMILNYHPICTLSKPRHEEICLWGFRPGLTQTKLFSHRRCHEA